MKAHAATQQPDAGVVVINIDERSLYMMSKEVGNWPWPRSTHAQLLQGILAEQPQAVVFDVSFVDPDLLRPDSDKYLIQMASASDKVYFPMARLEMRMTAKRNPQGVSREIRLHCPAGADPDAHVAMQFPLPDLALTGRIGVINFPAGY